MRDRKTPEDGSQEPAPLRWGVLTLLVAVSAYLFRSELVALYQFVRTTSLYSHILLVPPVSLYLLSLKRREARPGFRTSPAPALVLYALSLAVMAWLVKGDAEVYPLQDRLAISLFAFATSIQGHALLVLGSPAYRFLLLPWLFLYFMVPLPTVLQAHLNTALQYASGYAFYAFLQCSGTPVMRDGLVFSVPGLTLNVAPECSGIRSTLVLVLTSVLASYIFLKRPYHRIALLLSAVLIGVVRNGLRIFTLCLLTLHVNHETLDGPLHNQGGPPFFVLSLVPFFIVLFVLRRRETRLDARITTREIPSA